MTADEYCAEIVFSGARWDTGGHRCRRKHIEGSTYCRQHHDKHNPPPKEAPADQQAAPTVEAQATLYATLIWGEGEGPQVDYLGRYFARRLEIRLGARVYSDDPEPVLRMSGQKVKKDGTPGAQFVDRMYVRRDQFQGEALAQIDRQIQWLEDVAETLRFKMEAH